MSSRRQFALRAGLLVLAATAASTGMAQTPKTVSYTHLTLPTTPYV